MKRFSFKEFGWIKSGLLMGIALYVLVYLLIPLFTGSKIEPINFLLGIPVWAFIGLGCGYVMQPIYEEE